jgi:protein-disulfide isomerase
MNNRLWIVLGAIVVVVIGLAIAISSGIINISGVTKDNNGVDIEQFEYGFKNIITEQNLPDGYTDDASLVTDYVTGKVDSNVVLIEWLNYQCSACYSLSPSMREIVATYGDRVAFVQRYLRLSQGHPNGLASSVAAEAAARQGKFYEMGDQLFINQPEWGAADAASREDVFAKYAEGLGLDMNRWHDDYKNYQKNGIETRLNFQNDLAIKNGVNATPYIVVNGEKIDGTKAKIIEALDSALAK